MGGIRLTERFRIAKSVYSDIQDGRHRIAKSVHSDIQDCHHGGHFEILQTPKPCQIELKRWRHRSDIEIQNC